jgi:hypothetical protein
MDCEPWTPFRAFHKTHPNHAGVRSAPQELTESRNGPKLKRLLQSDTDIRSEIKIPFHQE